MGARAIALVAGALIVGSISGNPIRYAGRTNASRPLAVVIGTTTTTTVEVIRISRRVQNPEPTTTTSTTPPTVPPAPRPLIVPVSSTSVPRPPTTTTTLKPPPRPVPAAPVLDCAWAIEYLQAHQAPGFRDVCPGDAGGHQAQTCLNVPGLCLGARVITISVLCKASVYNEAHNSWVLLDLLPPDGFAGVIDPYGWCGRGLNGA